MTDDFLFLTTGKAAEYLACSRDVIRQSLKNPASAADFRQSPRRDFPFKYGSTRLPLAILQPMRVQTPRWDASSLMRMGAGAIAGLCWPGYSVGQTVSFALWPAHCLAALVFPSI
jgi:hypothetical protein